MTKWSLQYNVNPLIAKNLARVSFIAYAHSSLLTDKVPKWSLLYNIDLKMTNAASQLNATEIQKLWKNAGQNTVAQKIKEILSKSSTSVAIRISSIVALFELINFGVQSNKFIGDKDWENGFQLISGVLASSAAVLDIAGGGMEALSSQEKANKIRLYGARLAVSAATISFCIDAFALYKEKEGDKDKILMAFLFTKATVSLVMVEVDFGLLLNLPILKNSWIVTSANKIAFTKMLLGANFIRIAAYCNWIGIVCFEYLFKTYVLDDDLKKWCEKSIFGKDSSKFKLFKDEEVAFSKAIVSV